MLTDSVPGIGYVLPMMLFGNALVAISYGLFTTFKVTTGSGEWIGYQVLSGFGRGLALQMVSTSRR